MILIVESAPGGMEHYFIDEEDVSEDTEIHRYWTAKDGFELKKFAETANNGDFMHFSKGIFVKVTEEYQMKNKEIIPVS